MKTTKYFKLLIFALICMGIVLMYENAKEEEDFLQNLELENQASVQSEDSTDAYQAIRVLITDSDDEAYELYSMKIQSKVPMVVTGAMNVTIPANVELDVSEILASGEQIRIQTTQNGVGITIKSLKKDGKNPTYEGILEISNQNGAYRLINEVGLETYLKYVVPSEMPSGYPEEALKAQAVCARTYAIRQIADQKLKKYNADVDDTVNYQVYAHISPQKSTTQAVKDTEGQIITYEGEAIEAYFFSTSCGFTSGIEVWNQEKVVPYLSAVSLSSLDRIDTEVFSQTKGILSETAFVSHIKSSNTNDLEKSEAWYRWQVTFSWENLKNRVYDRYPEIGQLQSVKILKRSTGGAVISLELRGKNGTAYLDNEYDIREFFSPKKQTVILQDGSEAPRQKILPSAYFYLTTRYENSKVSGLQLNGGGYGHGVGMSQNGAKYMAENGMTWREIIQRFYQNITIVDVRQG